MKKIIFTILAVAVVVVSCEKQDNENTYVSQEQSIDKYITGLVSTYNYKVVRLNGSNRVVISSGASADSLEAGDSLYFHYSGYLFSGGKGSLFATNDTTVAKANSFVTDGAARK
ncbi:MAG: hypothetical protein PHI08_04915, partial [Bacteroidales bacterium]|nr:hypothetical protein [Bacteroidales bacterium]